MHQPEDGAAELRLALSITRERQGAQGAAWCPPRIAERLEREMLTLGRALPGLARQAVRLARVMERAGGRQGYAGFLYRLPLLRVEILSRALWRAEAEGRLAGVASVAGDRLVLHEAAMCGAGGQGFEMPLAALPGPAAWLDMAHNMLGFAEVARILAPALAGTCAAGTGEAVGDALARAVDGWVRVRVETQHAMSQGRAIRAFLDRRGGAEAIDDRAILEFWLAHGAVPEPPVDGVRRFRSAARLMLAFRRAERIAAEERALEATTGQGGPEAAETPDPIAEAAEGVTYGRFRSPLPGLAAPPADRVNWLPATRLARLDLWLGGDAAEEADEAAGLFAGDPPDPALVRTVLRADVFGALQNRLIAARGLRRPDAGAARYDDVADDLARLAADLRDTLAAAAHCLRLAGRPEVLGVLDRLDPAARGVLLAALLARLRPDLAGEPGADPADLAALTGARAGDGEELAARLRDLAAELDAVLPRPLLRMLSAAAGRHRRVGLRPDDMADPDLQEGLAAGAPVLADLVHWAERIAAFVRPERAGGAAQGRDLAGWHAADAEVFHGVFAGLYGVAGRAG